MEKFIKLSEFTMNIQASCYNYHKELKEEQNLSQNTSGVFITKIFYKFKNIFYKLS